jgi:putative endonuclease
MHTYWVYILASKPRGTLYTGVTNGIIRRVDQHRAGEGSAFTRKYKVHVLVWLQAYGDVGEAIQREKTIKEWPRAWKINLIEQENPHWLDLYPTLPGVRPIPDDWHLKAAKLVAKNKKTKI